MRTAEGRGLTRSHARRLLKLVGGGVATFVLILAAIQIALSMAGDGSDPSFYNFYPVMAGLGAVFGFERWWGQEQGDYNPFHGN